MKITKNGFFYFFLLVLLVFYQLLFTDQHRIMTFHDKNERNWIHQIEQNYRILDGTWDNQIGSSSKAIYRYETGTQKRFYLVIAKKLKEKTDVLLQINPDHQIQEVFQFAPYVIQRNNNQDYRGLMDIDMDNNLDLVVVVNGKYGKRLFIFPLYARIEPRSFLMQENYNQIDFKDLDQDGWTEIIAYTKLDNLLQPPALFHFQSGTLTMLNNADFPLYMNQYYAGMQSNNQHYKKVNNPILQRELLLTQMRYHIAMGNIDHAATDYSTLIIQLPEAGLERKFAIYKGKMLLALAFLKTGNETMMEAILQEAIPEFFSDSKTKEETESQILAEKGLANMQIGNIQKAEELALESIRLDPTNTTSLQMLEWISRS